MRVVPLEKQILTMKRDFPFVKVRSDFEFNVRFPDYPLFQYKVILNQDYPKSKPIITRDEEKIEIPILTYWLQTCTLSNVVQNLYLISMSNSNTSLIPPTSLSPPVKKTVPPLISPFEDSIKDKKSKSLFISKPICESTDDKKINENESSEVLEISFEIAEEKPVPKTGNEYIDSINTLKQKFKKKEISFNQFMTDFQRLQSLKEKHNF